MSWRKYLTSASMEVQAAAQFRMNFFLSILVEALPLIGLLYLWIFLFDARGEMYGYSAAGVITYYIIGTAVAGWLPTVWWEVSDNIRDGSLTRFLVLPMSYLGYYFSREMASQLVYFSMTLAVLLPVGVLLHPYLVLAVPVNLLLFIASLLVGFCLTFMMQSCIHLLAFWFDSVTGFLSVFYLISAFLSGAFFPLDFLPEPLLRIITILPFHYLRFTPLQIYLGNLEVASALVSLAGAAAYTIIFYLAAGTLWRRGASRYAAPGG